MTLIQWQVCPPLYFSKACPGEPCLAMYSVNTGSALIESFGDSTVTCGFSCLQHTPNLANSIQWNNVHFSYLRPPLPGTITPSRGPAVLQWLAPSAASLMSIGRPSLNLVPRKCHWKVKAISFTLTTLSVGCRLDYIKLWVLAPYTHYNKRRKNLLLLCLHTGSKE